MKAGELAKIFAQMDPNIEVKVAACVDGNPVVDSIVEVLGNGLGRNALIKTDLFVEELKRRLGQQVPEEVSKFVPKIVN